VHGVELVLILLLVSVSLLGAASRAIGVPYPIVLVLGGLVSMVREVIDAQRRAVVELRNRSEISNEVMHRIERELDLRGGAPRGLTSRGACGSTMAVMAARKLLLVLGAASLLAAPALTARTPRPARRACGWSTPAP